MIGRLFSGFVMLAAVAFFMRVPGISPTVHATLNNLLHLAQQLLTWVEGLVNKR